MNKIYKDITIVTVLYNSKKSAQSFFNNLENFRIIVVDNGKNEEILEKIKDYKNIKIVSKNKNIGYGSAVNFAVRNVTTKFFLILNPDLKIINLIKPLFVIVEIILQPNLFVVLLTTGVLFLMP